MILNPALLLVGLPRWLLTPALYLKGRDWLLLAVAATAAPYAQHVLWVPGLLSGSWLYRCGELATFNAGRLAGRTYN